MMGYFAYSAAKWFEPALGDDNSTADDALLMFFRTVIAFDRTNRQIHVTRVVFTDEAHGVHDLLRKLYDEAVGETARIEALLHAVTTPAPDSLGSRDANSTETSFSSNWTREGFQNAVCRVKEHIAAGDCYQVVLSQRFSRRIVAAPLSIYEALRVINPSPYMFFIRLGERSIIGASPEMLVRCHGPRLDYRPIAGTRRRGANKAEDWLLAAEMRGDEKEVAEHMMLVDLGRNDLGRVADYGSVQVDELMNVESYSHVLHLVSSLRARLRSGSDRFDALASCFPAGTVTGAPKLRAMQIIRDLEPEPRGVYAGTVLHADYGDNLDSCISIRTIVLDGAIASVQAGAGLVADSNPELEYEETINKAKGLMRALEIAEKESRRQTQ
jgi:anthranilate synthase component 1